MISPTMRPFLSLVLRNFCAFIETIERGDAEQWLTTASRGLGGEIPLQLLDTDIGTDRVQQELRQIGQGMPL